MRLMVITIIRKSNRIKINTQFVEGHVYKALTSDTN